MSPVSAVWLNTGGVSLVSIEYVSLHFRNPYTNFLDSPRHVVVRWKWHLSPHPFILAILHPGDADPDSPNAPRKRVVIRFP